eukprot:TRINITY_DN10629_c0_g1_i1.p1 TRINITY_DN10629_c0_g1~~TRINITY_DN10629_c0_g1_i1.p1  ORF type:complete len:150 (-),score=26.69 TRINITY_DN10629_c0_g1_i1:22-441(-)
MIGSRILLCTSHQTNPPISSQSQRKKALSYYRKCFRIASTWKNGTVPEEQQWIREEAETLFRKNMYLKDPKAIERKLFEVEARIETGVHYQIPYPRRSHVFNHKYEGVSYGNPYMDSYDGPESKPPVPPRSTNEEEELF